MPTAPLIRSIEKCLDAGASIEVKTLKSGDMAVARKNEPLKRDRHPTISYKLTKLESAAHQRPDADADDRPQRVW